MGFLSDAVARRNVLGSRRLRLLQRQKPVDPRLHAPHQENEGDREHASAGAGEDVPWQQLRRVVFFSSTGRGFQVR